jgi:tetratricopeptide (TPR) repeat protein
MRGKLRLSLSSSTSNLRAKPFSSQCSCSVGEKVRRDIAKIASFHQSCISLQAPLMLQPLATLALVFTTMGLSAAEPRQTSPAANPGTALLQSGKVSEARDAFESVLEVNPSNNEAEDGEVASSERLALQARGEGRMNDALTYLVRAQQFVPKNEHLLFDLGIQEDDMHLYQDADRTLATAEQLNPGDPNVIYAVARVKMDLGQLSAAEEKMLAYLKLRPEDASAHYGLARVYQLGLQFDKARTEFQRCIELQPVQTEAYYQLGDIALGQGNFAEAISEFSRTLARDPKHGGALAGTGQAYFKQKQYVQAAEYLQRAIAAAPNYQTAHYYLGLTLARLGRKEDSERELSLATKLADEAAKAARSGIQLSHSTANQ